MQRPQHAAVDGRSSQKIGANRALLCDPSKKKGRNVSSHLQTFELAFRKIAFYIFSHFSTKPYCHFFPGLCLKPKICMFTINCSHMVPTKRYPYLVNAKKDNLFKQFIRMLIGSLEIPKWFRCKYLKIEILAIFENTSLLKKFKMVPMKRKQKNV